MTPQTEILAARVLALEAITQALLPFALKQHPGLAAHCRAWVTDHPLEPAATKALAEKFVTAAFPG